MALAAVLEVAFVTSSPAIQKIAITAADARINTAVIAGAARLTFNSK